MRLANDEIRLISMKEKGNIQGIHNKIMSTNEGY